VQKGKIAFWLVVVAALLLLLLVLLHFEMFMQAFLRIAT
jgi:hypothetical protein